MFTGPNDRATPDSAGQARIIPNPSSTRPKDYFPEKLRPGPGSFSQFVAKSSHGPDDPQGQALLANAGGFHHLHHSNSANWRTNTPTNPRGRRPRRTWVPVITWRTSTGRRPDLQGVPGPIPRAPPPPKPAIGTLVPLFPRTKPGSHRRVRKVSMETPRTAPGRPRPSWGLGTPMSR